MAVFEFPLEKVLAWRQRQQEVEAARWGRLQREMKDLERALEQVRRSREGAQTELLAEGPLEGQDLGALEGYKLRLDAERRRIEQQMAAQRLKLTEQQVRYMGARRSARLLEKLRLRRLEQWLAERDREVEVRAGEAFLARWVREKGRSRQRAFAQEQHQRF